MIDGIESLQKIAQVIMCQFHFAYKLEMKLVDVITSAFQMVSEEMPGNNFLLMWINTVAVWIEMLEQKLTVLDFFNQEMLMGQFFLFCCGLSLLLIINENGSEFPVPHGRFFFFTFLFVSKQHLDIFICVRSHGQDPVSVK